MPVHSEWYGLRSRSGVASYFLAGTLLLAAPAGSQAVHRAPMNASATQSTRARRDQRQKLSMRARLQWEHHEQKVQHRLDRQRFKALQRQHRQHANQEAKPATASPTPH